LLSTTIQGDKMAKENKVSYPTLPVKQRWELREKAVAKVPQSLMLHI